MFKVFFENDANGIANSEHPDQTAPSLIWVCTVCLDLSVQKLRVIRVQQIAIIKVVLLMIGRGKDKVRIQ